MPVEYRVADALAVLQDEPAESAAFCHLDDAWARPQRNGAFGVEYPTHPFSEADAEQVADEPGVETGMTVVEMLDACRRVLQPGGILSVDTGSYLLPRVLDYLQAEWSPRCFALAQTTALTQAGEPDCSTPGMYGSTGGRTTVFAWRDATPVPQAHPAGENHSLHCPCERQREDWGWGSVKPLAPFLDWIDTYTEYGDRVIVPCAGTAPAAIATEWLHGEAANVLAVDIEKEAKTAYERHRADELDRQTGLARWSA